MPSVPSSRSVMDMMPDEPGQDFNQKGFEELCTRWNREEAEAVDKAKRTLQSPNTTKRAKLRGIEELEYWAIRRGGYDAEIVLIGALKSPDRDLAGQAHVSLKKTWASHFNAWVNSAISNAKAMMIYKRYKDAMEVFDKLIFENPLWGEGFHLRAKLKNEMGDVNGTIEDLEKALEFCPNNYLVMVELGLSLMDKRQDYDGCHRLLRSAGDLCPLLPIDVLAKVLYAKAPHLQAQQELEDEMNTGISLEAPPVRLLPEGWVSRLEATERPNQAFLRVGAELEQWFAQVQQLNPTRQKQRKLWGMLVIAWDPDKHPRQLRSFTTQVHDAIKARRERELSKAVQGEEKATMQVETQDEDEEDAREFLRRVRLDRRRQRRKQAQSEDA